jgi:hypothetical protein
MSRKCAVFFLSVVFCMVLFTGFTSKQSPGSAALAQPTEAQGVLATYDVVLVKEFETPPNLPAPAESGDQLADKIVYQIKRYSQKQNLFSLIARDETQKPPAGKKTLVIQGEVREYSEPTIGGRIGRSFIPGGEFTGSAAFAAHYQFIDKDTGKVMFETDLRTTSTGRSDTVDYAMERNAEAAAKVVSKQKTGR